jgi:hypothetical protein
MPITSTNAFTVVVLTASGGNWADAQLTATVVFYVLVLFLLGAIAASRWLPSR